LSILTQKVIHKVFVPLKQGFCPLETRFLSPYNHHKWLKIAVCAPPKYISNKLSFIYRLRPTKEKRKRAMSGFHILPLEALLISWIYISIKNFLNRLKSPLNDFLRRLWFDNLTTSQQKKE